MEQKLSFCTSEILIRNMRSPLPYGLTVIQGPHAASGLLLQICAKLALRGPVRILDCGNRSDMYQVARELRPLTRDPATAMQRIHLSRAFTCYQAEALLGQNRGQSQTPILIFDLLATYLDESVSKQEAERLFDDTLDHLQKMSRKNPVLVGIRPLPAIALDRSNLPLRLQKAADESFQLMEISQQAETNDDQLSLF